MAPEARWGVIVDLSPLPMAGDGLGLRSALFGRAAGFMVESPGDGYGDAVV